MRNLWLACIVLAVGACGGSDDGNGNPTADAAVKDAPLVIIDGPPGGGADARPGGGDAGLPLCASKTGGMVVCACSDGMDNDHDGFTDAADPECTGPQDNDEATYATGIPGDNSDPFAQDCFFDGDSGGGNDGCRWDIRCIDPPAGQHCNNNALTGCEKCKPLVPNGCDCFGCCDVYVSGVAHTVRIIDGCTAAVINDASKCPVCTKVTECMNPCDLCEVCIGKPEPDPSCKADGGVAPGQCPPGILPCTPPDNTCDQERRCVTGCCQPFLE